MDKDMSKNIEKYDKLLKDRTIINGIIGPVVIVDLDGYKARAVEVTPNDAKEDRIIILAGDLFYSHSSLSLEEMKDKEISFRIKSIKKDIVYGEKISILEERKQKMIDDGVNNPNKVYKAKIIKILEQGAYLNIDEIPVFMYNSGFAFGYIPISEVKKQGDEVRVLFHKYTPETGVLYVKMKDKYRQKMTIKVEDIKPQEVKKGVVRTKTTNLCFVNIAPMIDVLCSPIEGIEVGDEVFVKVTGYKKVNENEVRVRGKIVIQGYSEDFRL